MSNLNFSGGSFGATYTVPASHIGYGIWLYPASSDDRIRAQEFSQMVDANVIVAPIRSSFLVVWDGDSSVSEIGPCVINSSQTGWSALFSGSSVFIRKEVAGSPGATITTSVAHGMTNGNEYVLSAVWDNSTGSISVYVDDVLITTGTYTDNLVSMRAGMQHYNADNSLAVKSLDVTPAAGSPSINTITSPITHGQTGLAITTTGLGTLTSMTVDTVAVASVSATDGDGTWVAKTRVDGATLPGYGSKAVVVGDGTDTASSSVTVNPPATQDFVELTSVNTGAGYLGAYRTLNVGDQIAFDLAATLGVTTNYIDVDGGIYTDYTGSQTIWHWVATTRVTTQITLISGIPQAPASEGVTSRSMTSRAVTSRLLTSRGV